MPNTITRHEIVSTYEHSQYWQGEGLAHTDFAGIATGAGNTESDAFDDACEQLAQNNWDVTSLSLEPSDNGEGCECTNSDDCEHQWLVTIRVAGADAPAVRLAHGGFPGVPYAMVAPDDEGGQ